MNRLEGRAVIVTGAGCRAAPGEPPGIGRACASLFARAGAQLLLVDRDAEALERTRSALAAEGFTAAGCRADVADAGDIERIAATCQALHGRIDVLVNNVGVSSQPGLENASVEEWDRCFAVNVRSVFLLARAVVPQMRRQGGGRIVNVSSIAGRRTTPRPAHAYAASKAALDMLSKTLAAEFARDGIRCNTVVPGMIETPMVRASLAAAGLAQDEIERYQAARHRLSPTGRQGRAWDVAQAVLFLAGEASSYLNGAELVVDGGLTNVMPSP